MDIYSYEPFKPQKELVIEHLYTLFEVNRKPDYIFSGESHDFWEIVCIREGNVCVNADGHIFHLSKGDVIFHKPMELHKFNIEGTQTATLFITSFVASGTIMEQFENCVCRLSKEQNLALTNMISFLRNKCSLSHDSLGCLRMLKEDQVKFQIFTCMLELWILSLIKTNETIDETLNTTETIAYRKAIETMEARICDWITVPEIASECNVSVSYLKKIFAKYAGFGIHQYFLKLKISHATFLLKKGLSVTEIATMLSFSSYNYFSTVFRRETGLTPSEYKKMQM